ncbi:helix-turn-helix domain-containing protein [Knoellia sp. DB2414S]|uniref:Helix-turn-helix domain-containing protein n=1 Tax=Knoellia koreensis TaxID=2730921 RepID=A0A849HIZ6_9MICO|nr:helix-turn-helix domain-containing protein [Knoellia sp. DB2414S]
MTKDGRSRPSLRAGAAPGVTTPTSAGRGVAPTSGRRTEAITVDRAAGLQLPARVETRLREALPGVAEDAVEAIIEEVPAYAAARAFMVDTIEAAVRTALGGFLTLAARSTDPSSPLRPAQAASYELGRGEARNGRSLDALLSAYRIGARVSWRELSAVAVEAELDSARLARFAELVFAYIDELSAASVAGHAAELATAERHHRQQLDRVARDLLRGGVSDETVDRHAARASWQPPRTLTAVLVSEEQLREVRPLVDPSSLVVEGELPDAPPNDDTCALLLPNLTAKARKTLVDNGSRLGLVIGQTVPWREVAVSYDRARRAQATVAADGGRAAYDTDAHLAELVVAADREALADLRRRVLAPLDELTETQRPKLEETLRAWLLHRGRREAVAEQLFVHPQTVRYRVGQLRELFGDSLDDPDTVRDLVIALAAPSAE